MIRVLTTVKSVWLLSRSTEEISICETFCDEQLAREAPPTPSMPRPRGREMRETSEILKWRRIKIFCWCSRRIS